MIEYLTTIAVFSLWSGFWLLLRAESRLIDKRNKAEINYFMRDYDEQIKS